MKSSYRLAENSSLNTNERIYMNLNMHLVQTADLDLVMQTGIRKEDLNDKFHSYQEYLKLKNITEKLSRLKYLNNVTKNVF